MSRLECTYRLPRSPGIDTSFQRRVHDLGEYLKFARYDRNLNWRPAIPTFDNALPARQVCDLEHFFVDAFIASLTILQIVTQLFGTATRINDGLTIQSKTKASTINLLANSPRLTREPRGIHAGDNVHETFGLYRNAVIVLEDVRTADGFANAVFCDRVRLAYAHGLLSDVKCHVHGLGEFDEKVLIKPRLLLRARGGRRRRRQLSRGRWF
mmetsp:Transcript_4717/g.10684  ORF Transcript_4717/g.10684 Transcript_4717/m.10684 type:complete len:211 (-) Transcript_4717:1230-1862(-)